MVEWFKAHAWKACEVKASAGSNPVLCAIKILSKQLNSFVKKSCKRYNIINLYNTTIEENLCTMKIK